MTPITRNMLIVASLFFTVSAATFAYAVYTLNTQSVRFAELKAAELSSLEKEQTYLAISRIVATTETERAEIMSYFITEREAVSYIAEIEALAKRLGLAIETTELAAVPGSVKDRIPASLNAGFQVTGSKAGVDDFMRRVEHAPFHQIVTDMSIETDSDTGMTDGMVRLRVTTL